MTKLLNLCNSVVLILCDDKTVNAVSSSGVVVTLERNILRLTVTEISIKKYRNKT